ncbi:MAG: hypothetical protein QOF61_2148, partial [Acidobacteriota bacterium]|nr:hypothetical protein [Acidobacteriota bacterium]
AAAHLAACEPCAGAAREAAHEFTMFATAFGAGETLSVPTERLRAGIEARIAEMQTARAVVPVALTSIVERLRAFASSLAAPFAFVPRQATAFASFAVAAILLATIFYIFRPQTRSPKGVQPATNETASVSSPENKRGGVLENGSGASTDKNNDVTDRNDISAPKTGGQAIAVQARFTRPATPNPTGRAKNGNAPDAALLPVEKSYVSAIASLKSSIDQQGGRLMSPTLRAEYERNIAVVDRAIMASRVAARRDPADKDAQEFLRAAYQDKLDLLHTVADQTQIASIGR